jgi:hypothetical protein
MNWQRLRADLNGSTQLAFEELCAQLARIETDLADSRFLRLGTPDGGVEAYRILPDGSERAWQAKFFLGEVGGAQFEQVDGSVRRALVTHPRLIHYTVCIPQDRADPRRQEQSWFMDRWNAAVQRWTNWASAKQMTVTFDYWGDSELSGFLAEERHAGRAWLWFGETILTQEWLRAKFAVARRDAGERYDPQVNVPLRIASLFAALLREQAWFDDLAAVASAVDKGVRSVARLERDQRFAQLATTLLAPVRATLERIDALGRDPVANFEPEGNVQLLRNLAASFVALRDRLQAEPLLEDEQARHSAVYSRTAYLRPIEQDDLRRLDSAISELEAFLRHRRTRLAAGAPLVLLGEAGAGKTHLLCDTIDTRVNDATPALILLGQWFIDGDPLAQVLQKLDLRCSGAEFLAALSSMAECRQHKALLAIDALNESRPREVWAHHLAGFLEAVGAYPWIGVVVSCRTSYADQTLPAPAAMVGAVLETHRGFGNELHDAVRRYFAHYGIAQPRTPLVMPEFRNPLFLRLFCRAMRNNNEREVPLGIDGVSEVFEYFVDSVERRLSRDDALAYPRQLRLLGRTVDALLDAMIVAGDRRLPYEVAYEIAENIRSSAGDWRRSLLRGLLDEGVLVADRHGGPEGSEHVMFQYERLSDHLLTRRLLEGVVSDTLGEALTSGRLARYLADGFSRWSASGVLEALAVQLPERFGVELHELVPYDVGRAFVTSLIWRATAAFTEAAHARIEAMLANQGLREAIYAVALTVAGTPGHPLNGAFLDARLRALPMAQRDGAWTVYVNEAAEDEAPYQLIRWAETVDARDAYETEPLVLAASALAWLLSASNRRLRDTATKALTILLSQSLATAGALLTRYAQVDDPYVLERVAAAAYGATTRSAETSEVAALAHLVFETFFGHGRHLPVHLLTRDYLRGIVELAYARGEAFDIAGVRPPYGAAFAEPPLKDALEALVEREGPDQNRGLQSVWFSVMHHDFARYIIGTNSGGFAWLPFALNEPLPPTADETFERFETELENDDQRTAWRRLRSIDQYRVIRMKVVHGPENVCGENEEDGGDDDGDILTILDHREDEFRMEPPASRDEATAGLLATLSPTLLRRFDEDVAPLLATRRRRDRPRFNLELVQRYVMDYVLRVGYDQILSLYDENVEADEVTRQPRVKERIGKKYQWQGLHECLARIADSFVFVGNSWSRQAVPYDGPWQTTSRDIDASFIVPSQERGRARRSDGHWRRIAPMISSGALRCDAELEEAFRALFTMEVDAKPWVLIDGDYEWREAAPIGRDPHSLSRRDVWVQISPYLVREGDKEEWLEWAARQNWWNRWMPETPSLHDVMRGEFYWAPAFLEIVGGSETGFWTRKAQDRDLPADVLVATVAYFAEQGTRDASLGASYEFSLPCDAFVRGMQLRWNGDPWSLQLADGRDAFACWETGEQASMALWARRENLASFLSREHLALAWTILAEARTLPPTLEAGRAEYDGQVFAGVAVLDGEGPRLCMRPIPREEPVVEQPLDPTVSGPGIGV